MANERRPQDGLEKPQSALEWLSDSQNDEMYKLLGKDKERIWNSYPTSYPTSTSNSIISCAFSIIKHNRPWITDEEAMSIYKGYSIPETIQVKDDDWNLKEETFYFLDNQKFLEEEVLQKMSPEERKKFEKYLGSQSDGEVLHKNDHADSWYREIREINPHTTIKKASSKEREELKKYLDSQSDVE